METWKDVIGYEGYYQVSNKGKIKGVDRLISGKNGSQRIYKSKMLSLSKNEHGYHQVLLFKKNKFKIAKIHRLVAIAFLENPDDLPEVNHKDGNKDNNHADNLEWSTISWNRKHAYLLGLNKGQKKSFQG